MTAPAPKILICDDHELVRQGLRRVVSQSGLAAHLGEAANARQAMAALRRERWDLVVLDINLGGISGLEVLKEIAGEFPGLPVLVLSAYPVEQFALRVIRAGARGYLNKSLSPRTLIKAIRQVLAGSPYISQKVAEEIINAVQSPPGSRPPHLALSDREEQVLRLIGAGRTVGEIALRLILSVKTVSTYRGIVLRKLNLKNNAQIMRYALEHGLGE